MVINRKDDLGGPFLFGVRSLFGAFVRHSVNQLASLDDCDPKKFLSSRSAMVELSKK